MEDNTFLSDKSQNGLGKILELNIKYYDSSVRRKPNKRKLEHLGYRSASISGIGSETLIQLGRSDLRDEHAERNYDVQRPTQEPKGQKGSALCLQGHPADGVVL